jgi:hypothetical protein
VEGSTAVDDCLGYRHVQMSIALETRCQYMKNKYSN